jgi:hypothetical protein
MQLDNDLSARFGALRDADVAGAPGIGDIVARKPIDHRMTTGRRTTLAIAALCVLIAGVFVTRRVRADRSTSPSVARWQSPTTSLVPTAGQSVLGPAPLLSSVLDGATQSTIWKKGD